MDDFTRRLGQALVRLIEDLSPDLPEKTVHLVLEFEDRMMEDCLPELRTMGGFASSIADAYQVADSQNRAALRRAFNDMFCRAKKLAAERPAFKE
jgi:hypothetical protein